MQASDREEFDAQLAQLCAGFSVPIGDRSAAYWRGLKAMDVHVFSRVVDHCLGEHGPDRIPSTKQVWLIARQLRAAAAPVRVDASERARHGDSFELAANMRLRSYTGRNAARLTPDSHYGEFGLEIGPRSVAIHRILVEHKRAHAEDVRAGLVSGQEAIDADFADAMLRAEARIAELTTLELAL